MREADRSCRIGIEVEDPRVTTPGVPPKLALRKSRAKAYASLVLVVAVLLYGSAAMDFWWNRHDLLATLEREGLLTSYWLARAGEISIAAGAQHHHMLESGTRLLLRVLDTSGGVGVRDLPSVVKIGRADGRVVWKSDAPNAMSAELLEYLGSQPDLLARPAHLTSAEIPYLDEHQALILEPGRDESTWIAQVEETRDEAGLSAMIRQLPLGGDIAYFALQDERGIIAATPNVEKLERIEQSAFLRGVLARGQPATRERAFVGKQVLEIVRVFPESEGTLLRVGMSLDGLAGIQTKAMVRLAVSTGVLVLGVTILIGYLMSQQHVAALDRAYRKIETESRSIIDGMSDGLLAIDGGGRIVLNNPAAARILGTNDLDGRPVIEVARFCERAADGANSDEPRIVRLESGVELEISCAQHSEGRIVLLRDVTHLRRVERSLAESEKLAFLGRMASDLAHEIRNPLNAISMSAQMLDREGPQPALSGMIRTEIDRLNRLVEGFLGFRKIPEEPWAEADLSEIVKEVAELYAPEAAARRVSLSCETVPVRLQCRRDRLKQVLINIVKNALEATPPEGRCRIALSRGGADRAPRAHIEVSDTGSGIAREQRERVFEPFVTMKPGGTGIGLSIAGLIVREHGGEIEVGESDLGGALIVVTLPL